MKKWGPKYNPDPLGDPLFWVLIVFLVLALLLNLYVGF